MEPGGASKNAVRCSLLHGPFRQDASRDAGLPVLGEEDNDTADADGMKGRAANCRDAPELFRRLIIDQRVSSRMSSVLFVSVVHVKIRS